MKNGINNAADYYELSYVLQQTIISLMKCITTITKIYG